MVYDLVFRTVATRLDAERAHRVGARLMRAAAGTPGVLRVVGALAGPDDVRPVQAMGLRFRSPLGLAAGFDKDARLVPATAALGFGFTEVGTVTPRAQPGNPVPRLFRLPADRALVNRMGFNNTGSAAVAERLHRLRSGSRLPDGFVVGVNIGRNKDTVQDRAVEDYESGALALAPLADYLVVNVSSPNTPGLRDLQAVDRLRPLLRAVVGASGSRPVLVKVAPDLADPDLDALADLAGEVGLAGLVAANTTLSRAGLVSSPAAVAAAGAGGLSGQPLRDRALAVVERLATRVGDRLTVVAAGGIGDGRDLARMLQAGATLAQAYSGFVYGGPAWPARTVREAGTRG